MESIRPSRGKELRTHHSFMEKFDEYIHANMDLAIETKRAALKSSESVVSLVSRKDEKVTFACSGTIIGCEEINGTYRSTILTSASLLRSPSDPNAKRDDIEVHVYLFDGKSFMGRVSAFDFHFNLAIMDITTDEAIPTATLRPLDDLVSVDPGEIVSVRDSEVASQSFQLHRHSVLFKIRPGDMVVAIGRSAGKDHELMAAPGKFCLDRCKFDCRELFTATCIISKCGIGGPLINFHGEVIGVNFYGNCRTPFLPVNIVSKCLKQFGKNRDIHGPWLGMEMTNLSAASVSKVEKFYSNFNITEGVLVEEVIKGFSAEQAGIHRGDLIVRCGKKFVRSLLEFYDILWEKVGKTVEVVVIRESRAAYLNLEVFVAETSPDKVNRWPIPRTSKALIWRIRR